MASQDSPPDSIYGLDYNYPKSLRKIGFTLFFFLYMFAPIIVIPYWAYYFGNWFLLSGILVSYVGTVAAGRTSRIIFYFTTACIAVWLHSMVAGKVCFGAHPYITFYWLCSLWGYVFYFIANAYTEPIGDIEKEQAMLELMKDTLPILTKVKRETKGGEPLTHEEEEELKASHEASIEKLKESIRTRIAASPKPTDISFISMALLMTLPVVTVVINMITELLEYEIGLAVGSIKTAMAYVKGIEKLSPNQADVIMRQLTKGTIGLALSIIGWFGAPLIW